MASRYYRKEAATITTLYCNLDEVHENNLENLFCSDEAKENSLRGDLNGP